MRSSKPRFPEEIRAKANLCLQVGHIGRSIVEAKLLTAPPPTSKLMVHAMCFKQNLAEAYETK